MVWEYSGSEVMCGSGSVRVWHDRDTLVRVRVRVRVRIRIRVRVRVCGLAEIPGAEPVCSPSFLSSPPASNSAPSQGYRVRVRVS